MWGQGTVNWPGVFMAALKRSSRVMHFIMEHDNPNATLQRFCPALVCLRLARSEGCA
jgi:hypothetical protein